ncbi:rhodanese-like domain-containing protein [Halobacillus salinus]|uniref:rhodanese-like domain-containing protein n=1 Tax=Halobacillus salinus TaxID=192814 RepID=UPI0009A6B312|nr:rhodanese-like domain-containing protein [Halobacillus salinus]
MERIDYFKARLDANVSPMGYKNNPENYFLIDVRVGTDEVKKEKIPGSVEIPLDQLADRIDEIPMNKSILLYCWDTWCTLATKAAIPLLEKGYDAKELYGGLAAWKKIGFDVELLNESHSVGASEINCDC